MAFLDRLRPAPRNGGYADDGYYVWGSSPIRADDGTVHLFASRWPAGEEAILHSYRENSVVVRARATEPTGPYTFEEVVLPHRDAWDAYTHNPTVTRAPDGTYLLYYMGMRDGERRIGVATADGPAGPWSRPDDPIDPVPAGWTPADVNNPTAWVHDSGEVLLLFRGETAGSRMMIGGARAPHYSGPYEPVSEEPLLSGPEDPYLWKRDGGYHVVAKRSGHSSEGLYARSRDGVHWERHSTAYTRTIEWTDGGRTTYGNVDRPQLLLEAGRPTHLFVAVTREGADFEAVLDGSRCVVIPLADR